jgi:hypothetical protein
MSRARLALVAALAALVLPAVPARAGDVSLRAGAYTDVDAPFLGIEYRAPVQGRLYVAPNFELVLPSDGSYYSFSADLHYVFRAQGRLQPWLGAGLGVYARGHEGGGTSTTAGGNFIGGLALRAKLSPYAQVKVVVTGDTAFVLGFGVRF